MKNGQTAPRVRLPLSGGCQCGAVRYAITAVPLTLYLCHCAECQRQSAGAFGMSMLVADAAFSIDRTRLGLFVRDTATPGRALCCRFCPDCGVRLFHESMPQDGVVSVKAGTLDDTRWLRPAGHIWTQSAQPWVRIPPDELAYSGQPARFDDLCRRWRALAAGIFAED